MALLLGIDLGTSYFKVGLFAPDGALRGLGRVPVACHAPAPGRSELAAEDFWRTLREGLALALAEAGAAPGDIAGLSYSSQASTFLLLDARDRPLTPLVSWVDARGEPVEPALLEFSRTDSFQRHVGYAGISGQTAAAKWRWYQREQPRLWAAARRILTLSDYLTHALTGEAVGDASTAAFLGVYDLLSGGWWQPALSAFELDPARLAQPLRPGSGAGRTGPRAAELLGLPAGIPFAVGALDHHAAAIGSGLGTLAEASISTGTVLAALVLVERPTPLAACFHGPHTDGRRFYRLAFDPRGAGELEEYHRAHAPQWRLEELIAQAAAPATPEARAVRHILERVSATHAQLVRAVLPGARPRRVVATGGGSRSPLWVQMNADHLGVPVITPRSPERACLGAAIFAACAAGLHPSLAHAAQAMVHPDREFAPR